MPSIVVPCRTMQPILSAVSSRMVSRLFRVIPAARGRSSLATLGMGTSANTCPSAAHSLVVSSPMPTSTQRSATCSVSKARRNEPPTMSSEPGTSRAGNLSTSSTSMPARHSAIALLRPAGPAPTISTFETAPIAPPNKGWATLRYRRSRRLVPPVSVECRPGNSECLADFTDGSALLCGQRPQLLDLAGTQGLGSAEQPATCSSGGQAGVGPLPDEIPLKFSEGAKDMEDELPAAGRGVDLLLQRPEADAPLLQLPDGVDQMPEGAAESVQPPDHQSVAHSKVRERLGKPGAFCHGAGDGVGVELPAVSASCWRARVWSRIETRA